MLWVLLILPTLFGTQGKILNKCLNTTVNNHNTSLVVFDLSSEHNFLLGTYKFDCTGAAIDNSTQGYWIITGSDGINVTLNAKVVHTPTGPPLNSYVWKATLKDGPSKYKSPYTYQCVVSNDCGVTMKSNLVTGINYPTPPPTGTTTIGAYPTGPTPTPKDCVNLTVGAAAKTFYSKPTQRTIEVTWEHDIRDVDTGFLLTWKKAPLHKQSSSIEFNRTVREHVFLDLVPFTEYSIQLQVLYGKCHGITQTHTVKTLPDNPSLPRELKVVILNKTSLHVTWLKPEYRNGAHLRYKLFWESVEEGKFNKSLKASIGHSYVITNLSPNTNYSVSIMAINDHGEGERTSAIYTSIECKNKISDVEIEPKRRLVEVSWKYDLDLDETGFRLKLNTLQTGKTTTIELNRTTREHVIRSLAPFTMYSVQLQVLYDECSSADVSRQFKTLATHPGFPRNVKVIAINSFSVNVTWIQPKFPNGVLVKYTLYWKKIVSGEKNVEQHMDVPIRYFQVITGLSPNTNYSFEIVTVNGFGVGNRTNPVYAQTRTLVNASASSTNHGAVAGGVSTAIIVIIVLLVGLFLLRRRALRRRQESVKSFHDMHVARQAGYFQSPPETSQNRPAPEPQSPKYESEEISYIVLLDDWEILRDNLTILEKKLGGGQFGIVKQGLFSKDKNESEIVAVKMLKVGASASDRSDLLTELKILKEVNKDPHPNVLKLIGACSTTEPLLLVMEFCSGGNLRKFLLNSRVDSKDDSPTYINLSSTLTHRQLLKMSVDVASGMIHLASLKFVHRDLAARNVLIGENDTAKLSDFGLARDVKEAEEYIRSNQNLLPVKWMALESLLDGRFTTSSDIWSFGVLLYEIATLGDEPYKGMSPYNIVSHVGSGCRMAKPPHCSDEVYTIMRNCWKVDPNERPSFKEIRDDLYSMLTDDERCYINITPSLDEGPLRIPSDGNNLSLIDGSIRYTKSTA